MINMLDEALLAAIGNASIHEMAATPYLPLTQDQMDEIDRLLSVITG